MSMMDSTVAHLRIFLLSGWNNRLSDYNDNFDSPFLIDIPWLVCNHDFANFIQDASANENNAEKHQGVMNPQWYKFLKGMKQLVDTRQNVWLRP